VVGPQNHTILAIHHDINWANPFFPHLKYFKVLNVNQLEAQLATESEMYIPNIPLDLDPFFNSRVILIPFWLEYINTLNTLDIVI